MNDTSTGIGSRWTRRCPPQALAPVLVALSLCLPGGAQAASPLPAGGQFVAGSGSISANGTSVTIDQTSSRGIVDWRSFSIADGNRVTFNNGAGATLNRVTGGNPSLILGTLNATGSVYLINPQGVVVGPSGVVSTGGRFVASTLDADDASFMSAGSPITFSGDSTASVVNLGKIGSSGGDVFLIAAGGADNFGRISAPNGTVELAAGRQVLLQDSAAGRQVFVETGSGGTAFAGGVIEAAQISLQAADGNVFALAGSHSALRATGTATRDGHVWLVADSGRVTLGGGQLSATRADGSGGTVDTAAGSLAFGSATPTVSAARWNVTTPAFVVDAPAASAFERALGEGTSVNLQATGGNGRSGDIAVASSMSWDGAASLTLGAYRSIDVGQGVTIRNQGSGNLMLRADATAIDNGGSVTNGGTIDWSGSTGIVSALYDMNGTYAPGTLLGNPAWTAARYSGLVTQVTAYKLVNSLADLENMSLDPAGNYALGTDIDASATGTLAGYTPIGTSDTPFSGQFDGMGHTIDQLSFLYVGQVSGPLGLFGTIGRTGVVRNVGVTRSLTDPASTVSYLICPTSGCTVGVLAGDNQGLIANAYTEGGAGDSPPTIAFAFGGLVGQNEGVIERSRSAVNSGSSLVVGGLVAVNSGTIDQSYASGQMWANGDRTVVGGLVGINSGRVTQSYADGYVFANGSGNVIGGLVGENSGSVDQSFASTWMLPYASTAGGVVGINSGRVSPDVYWNVDVAPEISSGGPGVPASSGLTAAQMADPSSFSGWDFAPGGAWAMPAGASHPVLRWQLQRAGDSDDNAR